jgi:hypothetical protein
MRRRDVFVRECCLRVRRGQVLRRLVVQPPLQAVYPGFAVYAGRRGVLEQRRVLHAPLRGHVPVRQRRGIVLRRFFLLQRHLYRRSVRAVQAAGGRLQHGRGLLLRNLLERHLLRRPELRPRRLHDRHAAAPRELQERERGRGPVHPAHLPERPPLLLQWVGRQLCRAGRHRLRAPVPHGGAVSSRSGLLPLPGLGTWCYVVRPKSLA